VAYCGGWSFCCFTPEVREYGVYHQILSKYIDVRLSEVSRVVMNGQVQRADIVNLDGKVREVGIDATVYW